VLLGPKSGGGDAKETPKVTIQAGLVAKPSFGSDFGPGHRRVALGNEFPGLIQAHQEEVLMGRVAGELSETSMRNGFGSSAQTRPTTIPSAFCDSP
jgi:hypothetical protein